MLMTSCKKYEALLLEKLYGGLAARQEQELARHLASCPSCRATLASFQEIKQTLGAPRRPELPAHVWEGFWDRLRDRMAQEPAPQPRRQWRFSLGPARWLPALQFAAAAVLVLLGVFIGRNFWRSEEAPVTAKSPTLSTALPVTEAEARSSLLLERSKILLIGVVNEDFSSASAADLKRQRQVSHALLAETRELRAELRTTPDRRMLQLLDQLEVVLLQIANLEVEHDLSAVEFVREGINREGLLLKINLEELARQSPAITPKRESGRRAL